LSIDRVDNIHYQLLHRAASAVIEAKRFNAPVALMLVHAFEKTKKKYEESFQAYCRLLGLYEASGQSDSLVLAANIDGISLYCAWVRVILDFSPEI